MEGGKVLDANNSNISCYPLLLFRKIKIYLPLQNNTFFFHALRRQLSWPLRKPLINFFSKAIFVIREVILRRRVYFRRRSWKWIDDVFADDQGK